MLYSLFLYQSNSGLLMYDKNFQDISDGKMEMFSSFFAALKSFISGMVLSGSKELKTIELGDYVVVITYISETESDLVVIADKEDSKIINKIIPKLVKVILNHKELFIKWDHKREQFDIIDQPLTEVIFTKKKLVEGTSFLNNQSKILDHIWTHKGDLSAEAKQNTIKERDYLISRLIKLQNLKEKLALTEKLIDISEQLKDNDGFIKYQKEAKLIRDELKDRILKIDYYLKKTKESMNIAIYNLGNKPLKDGDYKDAYLSLYSFSSKLKNFTKDSKVWQEYQELAKSLLDKEEITHDKLSQTINKILSMKDEIDFYVK